MRTADMDAPIGRQMRSAIAIAADAARRRGIARRLLPRRLAKARLVHAALEVPRWRVSDACRRLLPGENGFGVELLERRGPLDEMVRRHGHVRAVDTEGCFDHVFEAEGCAFGGVDEDLDHV